MSRPLSPRDRSASRQLVRVAILPATGSSAAPVLSHGTYNTSQADRPGGRHVRQDPQPQPVRRRPLPDQPQAPLRPRPALPDLAGRRGDLRLHASPARAGDGPADQGRPRGLRPEPDRRRQHPLPLSSCSSRNLMTTKKESAAPGQPTRGGCVERGIVVGRFHSRPRRGRPEINLVRMAREGGPCTKVKPSEPFVTPGPQTLIQES